MARKLTPAELARFEADFDIPRGMKPLKPADKKEKVPAEKAETKKRGRKRKEDTIEAAPQKPKAGRPRKNEEPLFVRSFRLPDRTIKKLRVRAALDGISAADVIIRLVDELHVPGVDE